MFKFGTYIPHGIGKQMIAKDTHRLYEGMFIDKRWNGFGRLLWENGEHYIGQFRDGYYHGYGKLVKMDGNVFEGIWDRSVF